MKCSTLVYARLFSFIRLTIIIIISYSIKNKGLPEGNQCKVSLLYIFIYYINYFFSSWLLIDSHDHCNNTVGIENISFELIQSKLKHLVCSVELTIEIFGGITEQSFTESLIREYMKYSCILLGYLIRTSTLPSTPHSFIVNQFTPFTVIVADSDRKYNTVVGGLCRRC